MFVADLFSLGVVDAESAAFQVPAAVVECILKPVKSFWFGR